MRKRFILSFTAILLVGAGLAVGRLTMHLSPGMGPRGMAGPWFAEQLKLSSDQRAAIDAIWDQARQKVAQTFDRRHQLDHERDDAIQSLLTDTQRAQYQKIIDDYHAQRKELDQERQAMIHGADQQSRALLDDTQKAKWDELTKEIHEHHGYHGTSTQESVPATRPAP